MSAIDTGFDRVDPSPEATANRPSNTANIHPFKVPDHDDHTNDPGQDKIATIEDHYHYRYATAAKGHINTAS